MVSGVIQDSALGFVNPNRKSLKNRFVALNLGRQTYVEQGYDFVRRSKTMIARGLRRKNKPDVKRFLYVPLPVFVACFVGVVDRCCCRRTP
jgi:hypothetical protein